MKRRLIAIFLMTFILLSSASWLVYNQISDLQSRTEYLRTQNGELQLNNTSLQSQITDKQNQNKEQQDRLKDYTYQLSLARHLLVKITEFNFVGGFNPIGGLTLANPVNVTVQNNDVIPLCGLTLWAKLYDENLITRIDIGKEDNSRIDRIEAGMSQEFGVNFYTVLGVSPANLTGSVCVVTLMVGSVVLDEWKQTI